LSASKKKLLINWVSSSIYSSTENDIQRRIGPNSQVCIQENEEVMEMQRNDKENQDENI